MRNPIKVPIELVKPFVQGKVYQYFSQLGDASINIEAMNHYVEKSLDITIGYLNGYETLTAQASDYQCSIAMDAYANFKMFKEQF